MYKIIKIAFLLLSEIIKKLIIKNSAKSLKFKLNSKSGLFIRKICSTVINSNAMVIAILILYNVLILLPFFNI